MCSVQNDSFAWLCVHPSMLYDGKENSEICLGYILNIYGIYLKYASNWIHWCIGAKKMMKLPSWVRTRMYLSLPMLGTWKHHTKCSLYSAWISERYIPGIYQVYTYHMSSAAILRAFLVSQARLDVSDLDFLRILSVLATESPLTLGWGLPKFHSQSLISYTWLPLRDAGPWPSAHPYSKACFCRPVYLYGIVDVELPSRSTLPT